MKKNLLLNLLENPGAECITKQNLKRSWAFRNLFNSLVVKFTK